jgi:hypothetical protein
MVQAWVGQKLVNVAFYEFFNVQLWCGARVGGAKTLKLFHF